jgi:predicted transcriptional regulator of viral defense system
VHPVLRVRAERQDGVFTTADAVTVGYPYSEIRDLVSTGRWIRLRRGVLIDAEDLARAREAGRSHRVNCMAVLLALGRPRTVMSHASAATLWGLPVPRDPTALLRLTDPQRWRRGEDFLMSRAPLAAHELWRAGPVRMTSAARTLIDCAREWALEDAVVALDAALLAGRTFREDLQRAAAAAQRWPGVARAIRATTLADGRAESALETRGRLRILGSGLPVPELQVEIRAAGRLVAVVDAWFDDAAVAVEFDGRVKYTDPWRGRTPERVLWEEKRREDELRALDIRVVRIVDADLGAAWPSTAARLDDLVAGSGPAERRFTTSYRTRGVPRSA